MADGNSTDSGKTYLSKWIDFLLDPKTIIVMIPSVITFIYFSISVLSYVSRFNFSKLEKILDKIELVDDDRIVIKSKAAIGFKIGIDNYHTYLMQPGGNFVIFKGDPTSEGKNIVFNSDIK